MIKELKEEIRNYLKDLEGIVTNEEELNKLKIRTYSFVDKVLNEVEEIIEYKEKDIEDLKEKQDIIEQRTEDMAKRLNNMYEDIYEEYEDFQIECPYCNYEFETSIDQSNSKIICPKCTNIIELDWSGDPDSDVIDDEHGCGGDCPHCGGCGQGRERASRALVCRKRERCHPRRDARRARSAFRVHEQADGCRAVHRIHVRVLAGQQCPRGHQGQ